MFYHLLYPLKDVFIGFNLLGYITVRSGAAAVLAFLLAMILGPGMIRWLERLQCVQGIREDIPERHHSKSGTSSMGGLIILMAVIVPVLLFARLDNRYILLMLLATVWMGAVGFIDDYLKIVKKLRKGLVARYKLLGQILLGVIVGVAVTLSPEYEGVRWYTSVPFFKDLMINFGWFYIPMVIFVITGFSNAVNLTDGLDGLAIGLVAIAMTAWAGMSYVTGRPDFSGYLNILHLADSGELTVYCVAVVGASLGYLFYNCNPATTFMGDTGALSLGGIMGTLAVLLKKELLLLLVGGVFVAEVLSVILQVGSFKLRRKRIFRMAPLHHHYELAGMPEQKIVVRFWIVGILLALLTLVTFKVR